MKICRLSERGWCAFTRPLQALMHSLTVGHLVFAGDESLNNGVMSKLNDEPEMFGDMVMNGQECTEEDSKLEYVFMHCCHLIS